MTTMDKRPMMMLDLGFITLEQIQALAAGGGVEDFNDLMTLLLG